MENTFNNELFRNKKGEEKYDSFHILNINQQKYHVLKLNGWTELLCKQKPNIPQSYVDI